jgi:hypothetical protein
MVWRTVLIGISEMQGEGVEWICLPQVALVANSCIFNCPSFNALEHNGK